MHATTRHVAETAGTPAPATDGGAADG
jgi:hypothetical protein